MSLDPGKSAKKKSERNLEKQVKAFVTGVLGTLAGGLQPGAKRPKKQGGMIKIRGRA
jgi:hypothetical protein